jgi:hypothetical protein
LIHSNYFKEEEQMCSLGLLIINNNQHCTHLLQKNSNGEEEEDVNTNNNNHISHLTRFKCNINCDDIIAAIPSITAWLGDQHTKSVDKAHPEVNPNTPIPPKPTPILSTLHNLYNTTVYHALVCGSFKNNNNQGVLETTMPWYVVVSKTTTTRGVFETEIYHT